MYQLQVSGTWGGASGVSWRPAICGTVNQTGQSDAEASMFDTREDAIAALETIARGERAQLVETRTITDRTAFTLSGVEAMFRIEEGDVQCAECGALHWSYRGQKRPVCQWCD